MSIPTEWHRLAYWSFGIAIIASLVGVVSGLYGRDYSSALTASLGLLYFVVTLFALRTSRPALFWIGFLIAVAFLLRVVLSFSGILLA